MDILEQMMLEYAAMKSEQEAIAAERNYLTKMIELIEKVIACKEAGLSFEALEKAEMYLSEQAFRMEQEEVGNEKLRAYDMGADHQIDEVAASWDTSRGKHSVCDENVLGCLEDHPSLGLTGISHAHKRKEV